MNQNDLSITVVWATYAETPHNVMLRIAAVASCGPDPRECTQCLKEGRTVLGDWFVNHGKQPCARTPRQDWFITVYCEEHRLMWLAANGG